MSSRKRISATDGPIRQSGFSGGDERWRREREPLLEAISGNGDLLDACCANGYLLECLTNWGKARGLDIRPFGIDQGARLIELARKRMPQFADHFEVGNAWDWHPPRRYQHVFALWDCVPESFVAEFVHRLTMRFVAQRGRLILGAYGSHSRHEQPFNVANFLISQGYRVSGTAEVGDPPISRFAWIDCDAAACANVLRRS